MKCRRRRRRGLRMRMGEYNSMRSLFALAQATQSMAPCMHASQRE